METSSFLYDSEPGTTYIRSVSVTITWTDEADRNIRYTNQPDTFSITIMGLNVTAPALAQGANPQGGSGSLSAEYSASIDDIQDAIDNEVDNYTVQVDITLNEAGNQEKTSGIPGLAWTDTGNQYDYTIDIIWLTMPEE